MERGNSRLVVEIPTEIYEQLEAIARETGRYKRSVITDLVSKEHALFMRRLLKKAKKETPTNV